MKVVLDTNVLVSALMRDGFTRTLLLHPDLSLVTPEYALEEVQRHLPGIAQRMRSSVQQARLTVELLLEHVETVPAADYREFEHRAEELLADVDPDDAQFAALAMATGLPVWTQDRALLDCAGLVTISTPQLARELGVGGERPPRP